MMPRIADAGSVMIQLMTIFLTVSRLIPSEPSTNATPVIAPIKQCVVDTLRPNCRNQTEEEKKRKRKKKKKEKRNQDYYN